MEKRLIINIGRQFGAGGKGVARCLGERLGIPVYDQELISKAAEQSGFSPDLFRQSDEKKRFLSIGSLFGSNRYGSFTHNVLGDGELFKIQSDVIRDIASKESAIFVGRASDYILRDMDCVDVFITAPLSVRIKRIAEREGLSAGEAEALILKKEKARADYYNFFTFGDWGVAHNYDLCIDSGILGIEGTADFIIEFCRRRGLI